MAKVRPTVSEPPGQPIRLFRLFGIQFTANWSWLLLLALLVYMAGWSMRLSLPTAAPQLVWALAAVAALLSIASLYAHELGHALVARYYGIPVRTISLFLLGGMAHITRESPSPRAEFLIALAGPLVSLVIGIVGGMAAWLLREAAPPVAALGSWLAVTNISLAIFNLVPSYPLDGGRVLRGILWFAGQDLRWASTIAARVGQIGAVGLLLAGVWVLLDGAAGLSGVWLIMIAWFMYAGASSSHYASAFQDALRRLTVASVMDRDYGKVQADVSVQAFAEAHLIDRTSPRPPRGYAVYQDESLLGLLSMRELGTIPVKEWAESTLERATLPIDEAPSMAPDAPALSALHLMIEEGAEQIAIMAEGRLLGVVTRDQLARATAAAEAAR